MYKQFICVYTVRFLCEKMWWATELWLRVTWTGESTWVREGWFMWGKKINWEKKPRQMNEGKHRIKHPTTVFLFYFNNTVQFWQTLFALVYFELKWHQLLLVWLWCCSWLKLNKWLCVPDTSISIVPKKKRPAAGSGLCRVTVYFEI